MIKKLITVALLALCTAALNAQENESCSHPWKGSRVAVIGDSMTEPNLSGGPEHKYWRYFADWAGATPLVYAISGREWDSVPVFTDSLYKEHGKNVDAILIFMGTNDYNNGVPIGTWFTEEEVEVFAGSRRGSGLQVRGKRTLVMDGETFKGRVNIAMDRLKRLYPDKQIVILTPVHRAYAKFSENNVQPDENYRNSCGEFMDAYIQALKEAGNVWAVPVIDLHSLSGLNPMVKEQLIYFANPEMDQLHLSIEGNKRLARTLEAHTRALPLFR